MIDYKNIKKIGEQNNAIAQFVVDDFLIHYAAKQDKLEQEASQKLAKYKHITRKQDPGWVRFLKTQYIAHRIFRKDGLIGKYLKHSALKNLMPEEKSYLLQQEVTPWRFSFSFITNNPSEDFYEMKDIFSNESFLLYSPGINKILKSGDRRLWFNLIGFNGHCWQTFGPINGYKSFEPDDIFFYATETAPYLEDDADIINHIDAHPVPYMMLLSGSEYPLVFHKNDQIVFNQGEYDDISFDPKKLIRRFEIESAGNIFRFGLKGWNGFPHFSQLFYDENTQTLLLSSMTDTGFSSLARELNSEGITVSEYPDFRLNPTMLNTANHILKRKIELNRYEELFVKKTGPVEQKELDKINNMIDFISPDINAGKNLDLAGIAQKFGVDIEMAKQIVAHLSETIKQTRRG